MKALFDTNVIVDVLQNREPWCVSGKKLFLAAANRQIAGCITAKQIADIHYFSRKQFTGQENVDEKSRAVVTKLLSLFELLDTLGADCKDALSIENNDYEDAILIATAVRCGCDCIITRDASHYASSTVPALTPEEIVSLLESKKQGA